MRFRRLLAMIRPELELPEPTPAPPGVTESDRRETRAARKRIPEKWRTLESLLDDFASADLELRRR